MRVNERILSFLTDNLLWSMCLGESLFSRVWVLGKIRLLSPVPLHVFVYARISDGGLEFFPRMFLRVKRFCRGPEPHALGCKAYATQIGWFNYSMGIGGWD